jgi:hypothetical protein
MPLRLALAGAVLLLLAGGPAAAQEPRRSEPTVVDQVKTWSTKQWRAAQREWRKDKARWEGCRREAKARKLSGRANWSFHYECMTKS